MRIKLLVIRFNGRHIDHIQEQCLIKVDLVRSGGVIQEFFDVVVPKNTVQERPHLTDHVFLPDGLSHIGWPLVGNLSSSSSGLDEYGLIEKRVSPPVHALSKQFFPGVETDITWLIETIETIETIDGDMLPASSSRFAKRSRIVCAQTPVYRLVVQYTFS